MTTLFDIFSPLYLDDFIAYLVYAIAQCVRNLLVNLALALNVAPTEQYLSSYSCIER